MVKQNSSLNISQNLSFIILKELRQETFSYEVKNNQVRPHEVFDCRYTNRLSPLNLTPWVGDIQIMLTLQ